MNYKESEIIGTTYQRARLVEIHNQLGVPPHIAFIEEAVTIIPDRTIRTDVGQISTPYSPSALIPLINPETGESLGAEMTHQQIMVAIYSLYFQLVTARDYVAPVVEEVVL